MRVDRLAGCALAAVLTACVSSKGIHPDGKPLDAAALHAERSLTEVPVSAAAWPAQDWWRAIGDEHLTALIDEALRDNPGLAEVDARARGARAQVEALDAARGPGVGADGAVTGAYLSRHEAGLVLPEATGTFAWERTIGLDFSWGLDLWGGKRAAWEAALGRSRAADIDRRAARVRLSVNVARAYIRLREACVQHDIAQRDLERTARIRELTRLYIKSGLGTSDAQHQVDTEAGIADQRVAQADEAIDAARIALATLLGKGPDRGLDLAKPDALKPLALAVPANLPVDLLGRRPDLVAARWRVEAAARSIDAVKTEFLPNVDIDVLAGLISLGPNNSLFNLPARNYSITGAVSMPVFDGGRLRAKLDATDAEYDFAVAGYNVAVVRALNEVAELLSRLKSIRAQLQIQDKVLQNARRSWDDATLRYKSGLGTELDTLTVRHQLLAAEQNLAALCSREADVSVQLIDALGGGFQENGGERKRAAAGED
ncbi:MAG: efflux transporter outer membrane subunit [Rudaea sp.]|uniref:efflux transporter outer membrane subunit n=1 Tax=Rudaea sp. TaxID=2136325 RepID=UPI0039E67737